MLIIDKKLATPLFQQLYAQIKAEIETGVRRPGALMPSTRYLATDLALSRNTVDHAYQDLVAEGYLTSKPASGYHVTHHLPLTVTPAPAAAPKQPGEAKFDFTEQVDHLRNFPVQAWQAAELRVMQRGIAHIQPANGDLWYRQQLANYLLRLKHIQATPEQLVVTSGFNEAAAIIAQLLPEVKTAGLAVANPIAPNASAVWATLGVKTTRFTAGMPLPQSAGVVLCPTHNFPDGWGLDARARQALAAELTMRNQYLIELDTDGALVYDGQPAPAMFASLSGQRAFYYTNFDETLGSSLCAGVLVLPQALIAAYQRIYGKLANRNAQLQQQIIGQLIANDDLERFIRQLTIVYRNRRQLLVTSMQKAFGQQVTPMGTVAGSFVPFHLPNGANVTQLLQQARVAGVGLVDPDRCWPNLTPAYPSMVMSFRQSDDDAIANGVAVLAQAWQQL